MEKERNNNQIFTLSNGVSFFRLLLTIPVVVSMYHQEFVTAFILCWFAAFTDWLDGWTARKTGTVSEWGKVIDPVADKVLVGAVVIMLLLNNLLPLWFVIAVLLRDIIILLGSVYARKYTQQILPSLMSGKLAVSAIAFTGVMSMIAPSTVVSLFIVVSCALMTLSLWDYGKRLYGIVR